MEIIFLPKAEEDLAYWIKINNKIVLKKIAQLTHSILDTPFKGLGKPEALKHELSGKWSRRINIQHCYIYQIENETLKVYSLKGHY
ncbi:MAG: Txe/YoeB family addiction module toxin [Pelobium sp.]